MLAVGVTMYVRNQCLVGHYVWHYPQQILWCITAKTLGLIHPHLGCLSCISSTKECYQIGFLEGSLRSFFISYINFSEDLFGNIPGNTTTTMQPTNSPEADVYKNNKPHQKCWFIGFLKG